MVAEIIASRHVPAHRADTRRCRAGRETCPDQGCAGVQARPWGQVGALSPTANVAAAGHGPTVVVLAAVAVLVVIVVGAGGRTRRGRNSRRRSGEGRGRAGVVGIVLLGLVLGATVAGSEIAHAVVIALVAIGHALTGMLP